LWAETLAAAKPLVANDNGSLPTAWTQSEWTGTPAAAAT
jgi:hypothetical protein